MTSYTTFNINENVAVRLTPLGEEIHRQRFDDFKERHPEAKLEYIAPTKDKEGWSTFQLWTLMQTFGSHIGLLRPEPFETTIRIENKEKTYE